MLNSSVGNMPSSIAFIKTLLQYVEPSTQSHDNMRTSARIFSNIRPSLQNGLSIALYVDILAPTMRFRSGFFGGGFFDGGFFDGVFFDGGFFDGCFFDGVHRLKFATFFDFPRILNKKTSNRLSCFYSDRCTVRKSEKKREEPR